MRPRRPGSGLLWLLTSIPLRFKITFPYLILSVLLALVATYLVSQGFSQTLQKRFEGQLIDSANRANDRLFSWQEAQLTHLRTISHTQGVAEAVAAGDSPGVESLLLGLALNGRIPLLEIIDADGQGLYSLHLDPRTLARRDDPPGQFAGLPFVQAVLEGQADELGDKYVSWAEGPWGLALYTAGPILLGDRLVGAVLVGAPVDIIMQDLNQAALARVVLYRPDGRVAYSTLFDVFDAGPALTAEMLESVRDGGVGKLPTRLVDVAQRPFVEAVTPLFLRGADSGWRFSVALAQSLVTDAGGPTLQQLLAVFTVASLAIIGLGVVVAQLVAGPVFRLVNATEQVATGHLNVQVPVTAQDEIGTLSVRFNEMVEQLRQREYMRELFGRMVSEEVREAVLQGQINLGGELKTVSVLFADIRAFTALSEQLAPAEVVAFLNGYFTNVTGVVYEYGGIINRYGGDSTLAVFGAPVPLSKEESSRRAIGAALSMRRRLLEFNARRVAGGFSPIEIGIGVNTGEVVTGNVGSEERFEYTVIGDTVNISARVQELCKRFPEHSLLITAAAHEALPNREAFESVDLGPVGIRGRHDPVHVRAITGEAPPGPDAVAWAADRNLGYRTLLEALFLRLRGYPDHVIRTLQGFALEPTLEELILFRTEAEQFARHLTREFAQPFGEVESLLLPPLSLTVGAVAPAGSRLRARRHRPGPKVRDTLETRPAAPRRAWVKRPSGQAAGT